MLKVADPYISFRAIVLSDLRFLFIIIYYYLFIIHLLVTI